MSYDSLAVLLLMVGFVLIVAEIFVPSGGMIMVICVITMSASFWCAYKAWYGVNSLAFSAYLGSLVVLIPTVVIGAFKIFPLTPIGRAVMGSPTLEEVTPYSREQQHLQSLVGERGVALSQMMPGGMVKVGGDRLHAFSEGMVIEQGATIEVVEVRGNRVLVRLADASSEQTPTQPQGTSPPLLADDADTGPDESPLDFTLPQG